MHLQTALLGLVSLTSASNVASPQHLFANPPSSHGSTYKIPTIHESAVQARRIMRLENIDVGGAPIGLMDYFGDCEPETGNPTILAITIATSFKNVDAGSNITLSMRWHPQDTKWRSPASLPRFSLIGHLEDIDADAVEKLGMTACYVKKHPDAAWWLPGNMIHESKWVRLVVEEIYWIGGFGDRAYIGWIPKEEWFSVTPDEIEGVRLPGEKSQSAWSTVTSWFGLGSQEQDAGVVEL
ncbi:hypothetical protein P3342_005352 [Pyrenophora teres f. teres]|nr:hypothetical protein P3342_005352 [Pyrenophora teres f. teres]